jgi:hypothetical protein
MLTKIPLPVSDNLQYYSTLEGLENQGKGWKGRRWRTPSRMDSRRLCWAAVGQRSTVTTARPINSCHHTAAGHNTPPPPLPLPAMRIPSPPLVDSLATRPRTSPAAMGRHLSAAVSDSAPPAVLVTRSRQACSTLFKCRRPRHLAGRLATLDLLRRHRGVPLGPLHDEHVSLFRYISIYIFIVRGKKDESSFEFEASSLVSPPPPPRGFDLVPCPPPGSDPSV